ncbi:MAG: hypothetical protein WBZ24_07085 [Anaerolineales bacterium]
MSGSIFDEPKIGRQLSRDWLLKDKERYLGHIEDPDTLTIMERSLRGVRSGDPYETVIARGALSAEVLDYAPSLVDYIPAINPGANNPGWKERFMFVNLP